MAKKKLTPLKKFVKDKFGDDVPMRTAQHWCQHGHVAGARKIGRQWFVDPDAFDSSTGNELADSILMAS
ncbi:DNA-binding protein [Thalassolituus sp.]|uniref:DNA-binding protein n=1 Tax=Thalassolituus sp. TaxID=2030822 RepID=UPI00262AA435|nr:DNA-binding protein [Thalassolituus sp.]